MHGCIWDWMYSEADGPTCSEPRHTHTQRLTQANVYTHTHSQVFMRKTLQPSHTYPQVNFSHSTRPPYTHWAHAFTSCSCSRSSHIQSHTHTYMHTEHSRGPSISTRNSRALVRANAFRIQIIRIHSPSHLYTRTLVQRHTHTHSHTL